MSIRGAIIDVDGTVLRGSEPVPGAVAGLDALDAAGVRRLFVSNNPTKAPSAYVERFEGAGFEVRADEVMTSGAVTTAYLRENRPTDAVFLVGEDGLRRQLEEAGQRVVVDPDRADVVVASIDRSFDYDKLSQALWALSDEAVGFVGSDPDVTIPTESRPIPGSGSIIRAVAGVAEREPDVVLGKPSAYAREMALDRLGVDAEECLVVGDRLDTDIAMGAEAGMTTVLVHSGITDESTLADSDVRPDYVLESLGDVERVLQDVV